MVNKEVSKGKVLFKTIVFAMSNLFFSLLLGLIAGLITGIVGYDEIPMVWLILLGAAATILSAIYVVKEVKKDHNLVLKDRIHFNKINFKYLIGVLLVGLPLSLSLDYLLINVFKMKSQELMTEVSFSLLGIVSIVLIVLIAPIFEEFVFRFGIIEKMKTKFSTVISILVSSILFTAIHFYGLAGSISIFFLAIIIGLVYAHTRNLVYVIFMHFVNNVYSVIQNLSINENPNAFIAKFPFSLTHFAILLVLLMVGAYLLYSQKDKVKYIQQ